VQIKNALSKLAVMRLVLLADLIFAEYVLRIRLPQLMFVTINKVVLLMNVAYRPVLLILFLAVLLLLLAHLHQALLVQLLHAHQTNVAKIFARVLHAPLATICHLQTHYVLLTHAINLNVVNQQHVLPLQL
jgi:hypothetical protein